MSRSSYINEYMNAKYDRINLTVPKGEKAKIKAAADSMQISVNEYLYMLVCADLSSGTSKLSQKKQGFTEEHQKMLDKWQVAAKYREMIESMHIEEINGMNKHYTIILKEGYINDETGSRSICTDKMHEIRRIIKKSHKK
ncbi:MAG: hypothetical protein LIO60_04540 [Oscillospiraceae bacterium]|nr:hypothetical protein [Oscillospiraceae bacterium]